MQGDGQAGDGSGEKSVVGEARRRDSRAHSADGSGPGLLDAGLKQLAMAWQQAQVNEAGWLKRRGRLLLWCCRR